jgi:hypothetical protein
MEFIGRGRIAGLRTSLLSPRDDARMLWLLAAPTEPICKLLCGSDLDILFRVVPTDAGSHDVMALLNNGFDCTTCPKFRICKLSMVKGYMNGLVRDFPRENDNYTALLNSAPDSLASWMVIAHSGIYTIPAGVEAFPALSYS